MNLYRRAAIALLIALVIQPAKSGLAEDLTAGLSEGRLAEIADAVDRGLNWMARQQNADGSFSDSDGPATHPTAYALMAFLSRGHQPGRGRYGRTMSKTIDFLVNTQRRDGSFSTEEANLKPRTYTHALTGLALSESHGAMPARQSEVVAEAIKRALAYSRQEQTHPKQDPMYVGGWPPGESQTTWSCSPTTCWELAFMRSAHNAGFAVPEEWVNEGLAFIEKCFEPGPLIVGDRPRSQGILVTKDQGVFRYYPQPPPGRPHWANANTTSSGMLALQLNGRRDDPMVHKAAAWFAASPVPRQDKIPRFYFGCYLTSQAMAQAGGKYWEAYFPKLVDRLAKHQDSDGHWRLDGYIGWGGEDEQGPSYYTALAILCLTLPDQLMPIHQR